MAMKSIVFDCCPGCCLDWLVVETSSSFWAISEGREFPRRCPSNHLGLGSFTPRGLNFNWSTNDILIYCICIYMYNIYILHNIYSICICIAPLHFIIIFYLCPHHYREISLSLVVLLSIFVGSITIVLRMILTLFVNPTIVVRLHLNI